MNASENEFIHFRPDSKAAAMPTCRLRGGVANTLHFCELDEQKYLVIRDRAGKQYYLRCLRQKSLVAGESGNYFV